MSKAGPDPTQPTLAEALPVVRLPGVSDQPPKPFWAAANFCGHGHRTHSLQQPI